MKTKSRPKFLRQEWFRHGNIRRKWLKWRRPRGVHSKLREHVKGKGFAPMPGYGTDARLKNVHPCGLYEVAVCNAAELRRLDPKTQAGRIAKGVGGLKRAEMQAEAERLGIRILNPKKITIRKTEKKVAENVKAK
jgi:large subunit ribosomal protein L32e